MILKRLCWWRSNIVEVETIERVKPVLEVLEDEGSAEDDDDDSDDRGWGWIRQKVTMLMMKHGKYNIQKTRIIVINENFYESK
jgi:hypothetical protein